MKRMSSKLVFDEAGLYIKVHCSKSDLNHSDVLGNERADKMIQLGNFDCKNFISQ